MPYSTGGKASGSPVFSDSSTRNTSGRMTRKLTASTRAIVTIACQLRRGFGISPDSSVKTVSTTGADDAVPFLGEARPVLLESVPVGRDQQLHLAERDRARRWWYVLARRMQRQRIG